MGNDIFDFLFEMYTYGAFKEIADPNEVFLEQDDILNEFQKCVEKYSILLSVEEAIDDALSIGQTCGFYDGLKVAFNIDTLKAFSKNLK